MIVLIVFCFIVLLVLWGVLFYWLIQIKDKLVITESIVRRLYEIEVNWTEVK